MELKDYQNETLEKLSGFLRALKDQKDDRLELYESQLAKGKSNAIHPEKSGYCNLAWQDIKAKFPVQPSNYNNRYDGQQHHIPNICFKVPTGGGKTLLAAHALHRINQDYFAQNNGFILWVVPSETIYRQTSAQLRNREHPYRQTLDKASGGKTLILDKNDRFTKQDVKDNLCIMLLMLQSSNRKNKEYLKIFRDSGKFESFFPELDDYNANKEFLDQAPDFKTLELTDAGNGVVPGITIKHSLGNVLKILRPIVVIDEGHRATSELALETLNNLNPSFILELSATPKNSSNILANVGGLQLKKEQMIKLPIHVNSFDKAGTWQHALS